MKRGVTTLLAVALGLTVLSGTSAIGAPVTLEAALTGEAEVPGPGDDDGTGAAQVTINVRKERVCYAVAVLDIDLPSVAAHIHAGEAGVAGDVVVTLKAPTEVGDTGIGLATGCVRNQSRALLRAIRQNPQDYYVNVHTEAFPDGAVRGQLAVA